MLRDNPDLVVLDVRSFDEYVASDGHLERAVSAPVGDLAELWPALGLSNENTILVYDGDGSHRQLEAARLLVERGLRFVVQVEGGLEAWLDKGFAVLIEDAPLSPIRR
jgi:rhodanese-related sulfurtransferase